jgi:hypothetical protein
VVHEAGRPVAVSRPPKRQARTIAGLICCIALLAGCGGSEEDKGTQADNQAQPGLPVPLRLAKCRDWRKGSVPERYGTVAALRMFSSGPVGSSTLKRGPALDDQQGYKLLQTSCSRRYALGFKLYHLYVRAASFSGGEGAVPFGRSRTPRSSSGS